jgi:uncharacterized membrane protein YphA (DoxX/SURF4 family)
MKKYLTYPFLIRIGLACVFLANSLSAFSSPGEFQDMVSGSLLGGILPFSVATFVILIGFNDLLVSLLLFIGWRTKWVATWAVIWIVGVTLVIGASTLENALDVVEHLAFIFMALALVANNKTE